MLSSELVAIVEAQSLYDHVSGALNRRGIDHGLHLNLFVWSETVMSLLWR
jgi:hypothetical protein